MGIKAPQYPPDGEPSEPENVSALRGCATLLGLLLFAVLLVVVSYYAGKQDGETEGWIDGRDAGCAACEECKPCKCAPCRLNVEKHLKEGERMYLLREIKP